MARKKPAKAQEGGKKVGKGQASEQARFVSESERLKTAPAGSWPVPRHVLMDSKEYRRYLPEMAKSWKQIKLLMPKVTI